MGARRREVRRRRWGIGYRVTIAVLILGAAVTKGLVDNKVWTAPSWVLPTTVTVIAVSAFRDNIRAAFVKVKAPQKAALKSEAEFALMTMLAEIAELKNLKMLDLGASVFAIRKGPRWLPDGLKERWDWSRPHLERTLRLRLADVPQASNVRWTRGKGTIGLCWEIDKPQHKYWLPIAQKYGRSDMTQAQFEQVRADVAMGMSFEEFRAIVDKYAEIKAVPVKDPEGLIVGVLSVDLAARNRLILNGQALNGRDVEELITAAAKFIEKRVVSA